MRGPIRMQLALQGGGAKIYGLIAAMHAVEALEAEGLLKVTRVAGTSAGAIVGSLFAAGVPMADVTDALLGEAGKKLTRTFRLPNKASIGGHILFGVPFWRTKLLEETIDSFLKPCKIRTFSDIKKQT